MSWCCAVNCTNSSKEGPNKKRVFRFPRDPERRKKWLINCRRDKWEPTPHSVLCEVHFENGKFETVRNFEALKCNSYDLNLITYVGGCAENAVFKTSSICDNCKAFCTNRSDDSPGLLKYFFYTNIRNKGGLKLPNNEIIILLVNAELLFRKFEFYVLHNNCKNFIEKIAGDINVQFPECKCVNLKLFLVRHFFKIRSYGGISLRSAKKRSKEMYGTCSAKKKKIN